MIEHNDALVAAARAVLTPSRLTRTIEAASVGAALRTSTCAMHLGVCFDAASGIGFFAESLVNLRSGVTPLRALLHDHWLMKS